MAKEVSAQIKLQIPAGKANPAPPVGPAQPGHPMQPQQGAANPGNAYAWGQQQGAGGYPRPPQPQQQGYPFGAQPPAVVGQQRELFGSSTRACLEFDRRLQSDR